MQYFSKQFSLSSLSIIQIWACRKIRPAKRSCQLFFLFITGVLFAACSSSGGGITVINGSEGGFVEDQPMYPVEGDDPWFFAKSEHGETFRVLITEANYQVRQLSNRKNIRRQRDVEGDKEQVSFFKSKSDRMNFKDWELTGVIQVRLNPLTQQIEHLSYVLGGTPRTWQASVYFQEDLTRYRFTFPGPPLSRFKVAYLWRIKKRAGLSDAEAKAMAIEYLKSQTRK